MKIEFPALESEPLIYFLIHSGAFVAGLGILFLLLGLGLGWLSWGYYKRNNRHMERELVRLEDEVISLKRKLAEQVIVRPPSRPLMAPVATVHETLPEIENTPAPAPETVGGKGEAEAPAPSAPMLTHGTAAIDEAFPVIPALTLEALGSGIRKGLSLAPPVRPRPAGAKAQTAAASAPLETPKPRRIPLPDDEEAGGIEPFSFLMGPAPEVIAKAKHEPEAPAGTKCALSDIIAPKGAETHGGERGKAVG